jgi:hypothetical protein
MVLVMVSYTVSVPNLRNARGSRKATKVDHSAAFIFLVAGRRLKVVMHCFDRLPLIQATYLRIALGSCGSPRSMRGDLEA